MAAERDRVAIVRPGDEWFYQDFHASSAHRVGRTIYVSGEIGTTADGELPEDPKAQMRADFEGMKVIDRMRRQAFPKQRVTIRDMAAVGDKVWTNKTFETVHEGEFMGIEPTRKAIAVDAIDIMRVTEGKIVEHWAVQDMWGLMCQLGAV